MAASDVGDNDAWPGKMDLIPFHIFVMKEPDDVMMLMSKYGTNNREEGRSTVREFLNPQGQSVRKTFQYPEVVDDHLKYRHSVYDHNSKRHSPISLEEVWGTTWWPNRCFALLLAVTEVNIKLANEYFFQQVHTSMLE